MMMRKMLFLVALLPSLALAASGQMSGREAGAPDATATGKGHVQLAGDLGGTASAPSVPGLTLKAPLASPALTGTPTVPTAAVDTSTTQAASTAYVIGQGATATPAMDGTAAAGTSTRWAHGDHVHPTDTTRAPVASPTFTGTVTAPTVTTSAASGSAAATIVAGSKVCLNGATCTEYLTSNAGGIPGAQAWQTPTLLNSWVNFGGAFSVAGYYRDAAGVVHLKGLIKSGTLGANAFVLPAGYRPAATLNFAAVSNGAVAVATVDASGNVLPNNGSNLNFALDGISFRAEN